MIWDLQRALDLRELTNFVKDDDLRCRIEQVLDVFEAACLPVLKTLPRQVIHGDANPDNVLLDAGGNVCGIIDFGDMLSAPRVVELAIAASYLGTRNADPLCNMISLVRGYQEEYALPPASLEILLPLIRTRIVMSLCILHWRLSARPENDEYRRKSLAGQAPALQLLAVLSATSAEAFQRLL